MLNKFPIQGTVSDKLVKILIDNFPEGLTVEEGIALNNILHECSVSVVKDPMKGKAIQMGLTMRAIADLSSYLANRRSAGDPNATSNSTGITPDNFLFKFSQDFELVETLRQRILSNPFIKSIQPFGRGITNMEEETRAK